MTRKLLTVLVVALLVLAGVFAIRGSHPKDRTLVATFARTTGLYSGAKVKVLGVPVGTVDKIQVVGTAVQVTISYDGDVPLPADVHALIVPPSIVGDRFVQLAPAYGSGPVLADGAHLGLSSTGVPVELDDTYSALDKLARGLGPNGANADGALSRLVTATAENISGHGAAFNQTVRAFADAISTLAASSGDVNGTVTNLSALTSTLAGKDAQLRRLVADLATVGSQLNGQRDDISSAVVELQQALGGVARFTRDNRAALQGTINGSKDVTEVLARRTKELANLVDLAPVGLSNLSNIYIPKNWDPSKPWESVIAGRTGSANLRAALLDDLDTQLGFTLSAVCAQLPAAQQAQLAAFCGTLTQLGGNLGAVISKAIETQGAGPLTSPTTFAGMMGATP
jgi:phospholipid/cholesterol/gamma-HCH transport system substrate-binding protein